VDAVLAGCFLDQLPARLIGNKAYDSDARQRQMNEYGVEMISPNRGNSKQKTQDGCVLRRYRRRSNEALLSGRTTVGLSRITVTLLIGLLAAKTI
jgi:hypothetical protein